MQEEEENKIWTIGHSTRSFDEFVAMLDSFDIEHLVDVRRFPGSRKFPQFNKDDLEISLPENKIKYTHLEDLGGRRKAAPDSKNTVWRNASFMGYADYMETPAFREALKTLKEMAVNDRIAIMCSEAVWWCCHRSMVADALKAENWKVMHIMGPDKEQEHPYTQPAKIVNGQLSYEQLESK